MITFEEIYERAIGLLKDPKLSRSYHTNKIQFQKEMYPFLRNGVSRITSPISVAALLSEQQLPEGKMEIFEEVGESKFFVTALPPENASFIFAINNAVDAQAEYNPITQIVTFSRPLQEKEEASFEWYFPGAFIGNFNSINGKYPLVSLLERVKDMLAQALALEWGMRERNSLLDGVLNNLNDTDFKFYSPASSLTAKKEWVKEMRLELMNSQTKLDWDLRMTNRSTYGY